MKLSKPLEYLVLEGGYIDLEYASDIHVGDVITIHAWNQWFSGEHKQTALRCPGDISKFFPIEVKVDEITYREYPDYVMGDQKRAGYIGIIALYKDEYYSFTYARLNDDNKSNIRLYIAQLY